MKFVQKGLAALAVAASTVFAPVVAQAETLSDALVSAYKTSGLLDQQRALLRVQDENVAVAVSALRPVLSYAASFGRTLTDPVGAPPLIDSYNSSLSLSASLLLFDFGATDTRIEIAKENVLMARDALVGVEQSVFLRAIAADVNVISSQENVTLQANNVRLITQELRAARDRFDVGEVTQTDVSIAEARLAGARATEASAKGELMIAREEYKAAIGHYPKALSGLPRLPKLPGNLDEAKRQARLYHPDIRAAKRAVTVAELGIKASGLSMKPTISATGNVTRSFQPSEARSANVGVTLSGPIYSGGRLSALYRQSIAQAEASRASLLIASQGVDNAVGNAWAQVAIATASLEATDRQIRASRVALRSAREEASLGARTTLDVLNAEAEALDASVSQISARANRFYASYALLSQLGLLTADHLQLGIASYDPAAYYNTVKNAPLRKVSPQGQKLESVLEAIGRE